MVNIPDERGEGWVELVLIIILVLLVLVTGFLLLRPALTNLWFELIESVQ